MDNNKLDDPAGALKRESQPPVQPCTACGNPMTLVTTIADPLVSRVRLFECAKCQKTALIKEA